MTAIVLRCDNCGAPLNPEPRAKQVRCYYCQAVSVIQAEGKARPAKPDLAAINHAYQLTLALCEHATRTKTIEEILDSLDAHKEFALWCY
jgi:LSD1 subclass zinc finger protein